MICSDWVPLPSLALSEVEQLALSFQVPSLSRQRRLISIGSLLLFADCTHRPHPLVEGFGDGPPNFAVLFSRVLTLLLQK